MEIDLDLTPYSNAEHWLGRCESYDGAFELFIDWKSTADFALDSIKDQQSVGDVEDLRLIAKIFISLSRRKKVPVSCQELMSFWFCCSLNQYEYQPDFSSECFSSYIRSFGSISSLLHSLFEDHSVDVNAGSARTLHSIEGGPAKKWFSDEMPTKKWNFYDPQTIDKPIKGSQQELLKKLKIKRSRLLNMHPNQAWIQRISRTEYQLWHASKSLHLSAYSFQSMSENG